MSVLLLERAQLPEIRPEELEQWEVLTNFEKTLGYTHPQKSRMTVKNELTDALRVMGLKPFTKESVEQYKKTEARRHRENMFLRIMRDQSDTFAPFSFCSIVVALILCLVFPFVLQGKTLKLWESLSIGLMVFSVITLWISSAVVDIPKKTVEWKRSRLRHYNAPVPEFAQTAVELTQRVKGIELQIDELVVEYVQKDPFLVAGLNEVEYYLEVWSEPGYKQERMA